MRRTAAVLLLLLTASAAQAKSGNEAVAQVMLGMLGCCGSVPVLLVIALAIYDWCSRRGKPPPNDRSAAE